MSASVVERVDRWVCDEVHHLDSEFGHSLDICQAADCRVSVFSDGLADGANAGDLRVDGDGFLWKRTSLWLVDGHLSECLLVAEPNIIDPYCTCGDWSPS